VTTLDRSTPEAQVAATIDGLRRMPQRCDELVALLPEHAPLYDERTSAEVTRLRGWLLAAFADTGLPAAALPYALEALESGHMPYEVAGAAIAVRGMDGPAEGVVPYLLRALRNLGGADATVSFECYDPRWPFARPTTAAEEVLRTIAALGATAASALAELERLVALPDYPASTRAAMRAAMDAIRGARHDGGCACCVQPVARPADEDVALVAPVAQGVGGAPDVALEDQDGRPESFTGFFRGKPSVVAFFYTRCDNPYKCSLTVTKLASPQAMLRDRGLGGALRLAAITYDPDFDRPPRLKRYAGDRGLAFDDDTRCLRTTSGIGELWRHLDLHVNYGPSTVNRHQIEAYLLDANGAIASSFTRLQWEPDEVLAAAEALLGGTRARAI
jgi:protein SCO1/2